MRRVIPSISAQYRDIIAHISLYRHRQRLDNDDLSAGDSTVSEFLEIGKLVTTIREPICGSPIIAVVGIEITLKIQLYDFHFVT